jgi:FAD/FMN-containing dehydrogenase
MGEIAEKNKVLIVNVAHAGDGNLHPLILFDVNNAEERKAAKIAGENVLDACIDMGGTISGEHGIGLEKMGAMSSMFDPPDIAAMRRVKHVFDPDDIFNPGKMFPPETETPQPAKGGATH